MPYCPVCRTEYEPGTRVCADDGAELVDKLPPEPDDKAPVVVLNAATMDQAQVAASTLQAEGIPAYVERPGIVPPQGDMPVDESPELYVLVPAAEAQRAAEILNAPPLTEEELTEVEEAGEQPPGSQGEPARR